MEHPLRVAVYLNQFFAGLGGEEQANTGVSCQSGAVGAARALQQALGSQGQVVGTLICGDNHFNENVQKALAELVKRLRELHPDVLVAGPAFGSGRYGLACAQVCRAAEQAGIPAVTAMHPENPGAAAFRRHATILPTGETSTAMPAAVAGLARLALKLGRGGTLGPAEVEGTLSRGVRVSYDRGRPGYERALDMLLAKLHDRPFATEVPYRAPERVPPAAPILRLEQARIAMVTTGGLVRKGNPDRQVGANATRFHRHSVAELESLSPKEWEAYHAGYFNHIVNQNPNYILPLNFLRDLEARHRIGKVHEFIYALPGVSTPVHVAAQLGRGIAEDLKAGGVDGALLVAT
ncbi:MAG: glycine/betaine/sarcosine/D-proline family reductase selenoprotein B [SAR324 cluster bacterium]